MPRAGCAEPGCSEPVARGSYCDGHAAVYYEARRHFRGVRLEWWDHGTTSDVKIPVSECDAVRGFLRDRSRTPAA